MDAKRKANFINAIATGEAMPCLNVEQTTRQIASSALLVVQN